MLLWVPVLNTSNSFGIGSPWIQTFNESKCSTPTGTYQLPKMSPTATSNFHNEFQPRREHKLRLKAIEKFLKKEKIGSIIKELGESSWIQTPGKLFWLMFFKLSRLRAILVSWTDKIRFMESLYDFYYDQFNEFVVQISFLVFKVINAKLLFVEL